jgi:peptidoglycan DL-endopeptidase CwlO
MRATARTKPALGSGVRLVVVVASLSALSAAGMWAGAGPAHADAITDKQAEADRLAAAIQQEGLHAERLAERANLARIHVDDVQRQLDATRVQARALDDQRDAVAQLVRNLGVESYISSGRQVGRAVESGGGPVGPQGINELLQRQVYASIMVAKEDGALQTLATLRRQAADAERQLGDEQQQATASLHQLSADSQAASAAAAAQQATLNQVKGELVALVRARQAALAAAQAARVRAQLAAQAAARAAAQAAAAARSGSSGRPPVAPTGPGAVAPADPAARGADTALNYAKAQLGKPYLWGGAGPNSFDCSGLTMMAWGAAGVALPHLAQAQYALTRRVELTDLKPGDLIFYGTPTDVHHVGIYVGDGNMIEAPQTGDVVKYSTIYWGDLLAGGRIVD